MCRIQRRFCLLLAVSLLTTAVSAACAHDPVGEMAVAAQRFLDALNEKERKQAIYEMSDDERQNWHFLPDKFIKPDGVRYGLPLEQMSADQRALAYALLSAGMSHQGFLTAMTITSLEKVLHDLENQSPIRKSELYYVTIFGEPGDEQTWGWRFEGHHLSVNFAIVGGKLVSVTPTFFGANPGVVKQGSRQGLQTLRDVEQFARQLVTSLSDEQKQAAILSDTAPADIITGEQREVDKGPFTPAKGIVCDELNETQREVLLQLIKAYAEKFRPEIVDQINQRTKLFELKDVTFAWAGGLQPGQGHYYRVQTPRFLFEYDNTQNNANHVHAVWRDFEGDFGVDLLRKHYEDQHAKKPSP